MSVPQSLSGGPVPGILQQVGMEAIHSGDAVLRGDIIGPRNRLFDESSMEALYAAIPVQFPDEFAQVNEEDRQIALAWLVPITGSEAKYIESQGWEAFEDRLVEAGVDATNVYRDPVTS